RMSWPPFCTSCRTKTQSRSSAHQDQTRQCAWCRDWPAHPPISCRFLTRKIARFAEDKRSPTRPRSFCASTLQLAAMPGCRPCAANSFDAGPNTNWQGEENSMSYPIADIEDIDADEAKALKSVGIRTTEKLLEAAKSPKGRKQLAAKTEQ